MGGLLSQLVSEAVLSPDASFKAYGVKLKGKEEREYLRAILEKLPALKWIYVEKSGVKAVPEAIDLAKELRGLVLPHNAIRTLPSLSLTHLTHVNLSYNALSTFPDALLRCEALERIELSHNTIAALPPSLAALKQLEMIDLSHNPLTTFPPALFTCRKLRHLVMENCSLQHLPAAADWTSSLRKHLLRFQVSHNALSTLQGLEVLAHLQFLAAANTHLDQFPEPVTALARLEYLDLSHNRIVQIPVSLSSLSKLATLRLNDNRILEIPKHIKALTQLRELILHENLIHRISKGISHCKRLYKLSLEYNNLTRLPVELRQLDALSLLTLHANKFKLLPEPFYHLDFIQHLFFLTLEDNPLPLDFIRGMDDLGARTYLLTREISQSQETDSTAKRPARPRPSMQRLASQYGTLRGAPGSSASSPFPSFPSPIPPTTPPLETNTLEVPSGSISKGRRFSSPGRKYSGTGSLTPSASRNAAAATQESQTHHTPGITQPQAAFMGSANPSTLTQSGVSRGQMPPFNKFKEAFDQLFRDIDFSLTRRDELNKCSPEDKWKLLRLYKGPLIELLSNNVEKLNRDRKFDEWQKRDKKLKAMADAHASADMFVSSLRQGTLSLTEMNSLRLLLDVAPLPWIYQFLDSGGLLHTINYLERLVFKTDKSAQEIVCESGAISVLAYFLKNDKIASLVLTSPDAVNTITRCLKAAEPLTRRGALELLFDLTKIHSFAPRLVSIALESMSHEQPFTVLVDLLRSPQTNTTTVHDHAMCLGVLNRLLESQADIINRYRMRSQMSKLGIESALELLNQLPDNLLQVELTKWDTSAARDEDEIKRLAAQDYRVLARLQEGDTNTENGSSHLSVAPAGSESIATKPARAFKFSEKRSRSLSVGLMSVPSASPTATPRTTSTSSAPDTGSAAPTRRAIRVLVSDIGSLSLLYTDTMTAADVVSKILMRHELDKEKFGLFFVGTDVTTGHVAGFWIKDTTSRIADLVLNKVDAVLSYKTLPWKILVDCPVHRCSFHVELEPSWTVGQATAHIVTTNSSQLSVDVDYDLFAGGQKLDESTVLSTYEASIFAPHSDSETHISLFPRPEPHRVFFAADIPSIVVDIDPRLPCCDILASILAKCLTPPPYSADDLALCFESKGKQSKRGSARSIKSEAESGANVGRYTWLNPTDAFWTAHFDKRRQKLKVALRPRTVFVSLDLQPEDTKPHTEGPDDPAGPSPPPSDPDSANRLAGTNQDSSEKPEPDSLESPSHGSLPERSASVSSVSLDPCDDDESESDSEKGHGSSQLLQSENLREARLDIGFDETVSSTIRVATKILCGQRGDQAINFTLFKADKLLNRQKTLKEVGVMPGDHLVLRSAASAAAYAASEESTATPDDIDVHSEDDDGSGRFTRYEGNAHTTQALSAATLNQLMLRLTDPIEYDKVFMETFLLTYRSFTTPETVLEKIIQRYRAPQERVGADKVDTVRVRCLVFMTNWLDKSAQDLNDRVLERMNIWIESEVEPERRPVLLKTLNRVRERSTDVELMPTVAIRYKSQAPRFIELEPEEIARQLTLDVWVLYCKVTPVEFFDCAWAKPKLQHLAPNLLVLINRFNFYAQWTVTEIVAERRLKARKQVWTKLIRVAEHLRQLNNFHLMYALVTAFSNSAVSRLKWTVEKLSKATKQTLSDLEALMAMEGSFRNYRESLQQLSSVPCVPYVGVPLKDLTFIEDGNPSSIDGLINWSKRKLVFDVVGDFLRHQIVPYRIAPISIAELPHTDILRNLPILEEAEQFRLSMEVEPRGAKLESLVQ